ncbi:hypothetical protein KEM54_005117 [Ascosphaera aggregata]|nr:hypothetical protein KEM54_005117 [Ascosphaera aggregata]
MPAVPAGGRFPRPYAPDESRRVSAPHTFVNSMVQSPVVFAAESRFPPPFPTSNSPPFDASPGSGYLAPTKRQLDDAEGGESRRTCSSPGFTERLANRISTAFGPPTVIHHPASKIRTGLNSILYNPQAAPLVPVPSINNNDNNTVDDKRVISDASIQSRGDIILSPAGTASTGPTTDSSSILSPDARERAFFSQASDIGRFRVSSPMSLVTSRGQTEYNLEQYQPSIVTVEAAATAKIYFETYFNAILSAETPREQRQKAFESRLASLPMTWEEKNRARQIWRKQESEYLRQSRVLKSKADFRKDGEGMSIAGYEVIKVLGKGSFGVVRLVREKVAENENEPPHGKANDLRDETAHHRPRAASAMDALRAAVDGSRSCRRRELSKAKKEVYAMKVIRKSDMLRNCQEGHLRAERDFLVASAKSQWVVSLIASFQDQHYLYLVMDYMVGGDFLGLLIRKNILSEEVTRFYIAEMILCVEEAHRLRWIHRDVKPDNFLISASGHLKISDFGLAFNGHWSHTQSYYTNHRQSLLDKLGIHVEGDLEDKKTMEKAELEKMRHEGMSLDLEDEMARDPNFYMSRVERGKEYNRMEGRDTINPTGPPPGESILKWRNKEEKRKLAKSVVGTSQYMAPEVIRGELYDGRCDWWSIGIILYECLYGFTPFTAENRHDTKLKILKHTQTLRFPVESSSERLVSAEAIDLIEQILQEKEYRLCSKKYLLNDFAHSDRYPGELINCPADKHSKNYRGYFVYSNDAEDIKAHPFFKGMRWQEVHLRRPPFVPKVKGWEDTRYFDDEEPISDIANTTVTDGGRGANKAGDCQGLAEVLFNGGNHFPLTPPASPRPCPLKHYVTTCRHPCVVAGAPPPDEHNTDKKEKGHRKREKKRPRDKILRDDDLAEKALKLRKRGAFLGYAYRRPKDMFSELGIERGRSLIAARDYS